MHASSRLIIATILTTIPFLSSSALTIPDSVPDLLPSPNNPNNNVLPPSPPSSPAADTKFEGSIQQKDAIRVLVCGDSITQGIEGQFTWRYRLWEWFQANSEQHHNPSSSSPPSQPTTNNHKDPNHYPAIHFVGPYNGTLPITTTTTTNNNKNSTAMTAMTAWGADPTRPQTWGTYHPAVDPAFHPGGGSAHFAVYGRPAWMDVDLIGDQVRAHRPDLVVLHLGFNDIGWWGHTAADLLDTVQRLVFFSRLAASGGIAVLVADVSHRAAVPGRDDIPATTAEYNRAVVEKARGWSTPESPVEVVRVSEVYDCHTDSCPAGHDGLHPNALGDYQIARAYSQVLHDRFGLGSAPLEVPPVHTIPGMSSSGTMTISKAIGRVVLSAPPLGVLAGVVLLGLVLTMVLRPELLRLRRLGKARYHLLPSR